MPANAEDECVKSRSEETMLDESSGAFRILDPLQAAWRVVRASEQVPAAE